jgi:hypothetical protein
MYKIYTSFKIVVRFCHLFILRPTIPHPLHFGGAGTRG